MKTDWSAYSVIADFSDGMHDEFTISEDLKYDMTDAIEHVIAMYGDRYSDLSSLNIKKIK